MSNDSRVVPVELLQKWLDDLGPYKHLTNVARKRCDDLRAILAQPAAPVTTQEPVNLPSAQDDGAEGRGYNKALKDCASALEAAGVVFTNDPRTDK